VRRDSEEKGLGRRVMERRFCCEEFNQVIG